MKKIVILLSFVLSAFIISSCAENNPNNPSDNSNNITLAERAGTYSGTIMNMPLEILLNENATVTSIKVNNVESIEKEITISEGPSYTGTVIAPFDATVKMPIQPGTVQSSPAKVKITFKSNSDASQGATAKVQVGAKPEDQFDETSPATITVELTYTK